MNYSESMNMLPQQMAVSGGLFDVNPKGEPQPVRAKALFQFLPVRLEYSGPIRTTEGKLIGHRGIICVQVANCMN